MKINRVYFMIHPTCWAEHPDGPPDTFVEEGRSLSDWYAALNWERRVNREQMRFIDEMAGDEALVVYPIGGSPEMRELIEHGERALGARCVVIRSEVRREPEQLEEMSEPIRRFLEDESMDGRQEYWDVLPEDLRGEVAEEVREAGEAGGYDWRPAALKVVQGNRLYAREIADELAARGLEVDPETVKAEAYGEGFEQCAVTWKAMVADYLGWANPIENRFDLSVSGAPVLFDAEFRERLQLQGDIRLFLWEKSQGRPMALFARARAMLADPSYAVDVPMDGLTLEVWGTRDRLWPNPDSTLSTRNGHLRVPVLSGLRKMEPEHETCYVIGCNVSYDRFREVLLDAAVSTQ